MRIAGERPQEDHMQKWTEVFCAVLYLLCTDGQRRALRGDFSKWRSAFVPGRLE